MATLTDTNSKNSSISISKLAYGKILLHAAKYPHCAVNGLILADKKNPKGIRFVDCIPLFHLSLTLAPMLEVALTQVEAHCKKIGLVIAGYYQANECLKDLNPTAASFKIGDRIFENNGDSFLLMVQNNKLNIDCDEPAYRLYRSQEGKWKQVESKNYLEDGCLIYASTLLEAKCHRELYDFDNHLDDISLDWKNLHIKERMEHLL